MFDRPHKILRLACFVFGAILVCQFALLIKRGDPLNRLTIPAVPTLASASDTNSASVKGADKQGTNSAAAKDSGKKGTNALASAESAKTGTNAASAKGAGKGDTNSTPGQTVGKDGTNGMNGTNVVLVEEPQKAGTNAVASKTQAEGATNSASSTNSAKGGTNLIAGEKSGKQGTNSASKSGTNAASSKEMAKKGGPPGSRQEPGKAADLPPLIKARIERITQSEILGQIVRPMPMALLGIADKDVFLRAPDGQTGTIKEGGELGGIKLLKVGTNRILVEQEGQKKELTLFSGLGSETLMPKTTERTNETKKTP
jgi:hypothetical protein